ncbi:glycoside hydrolase family 88/105 protein [Echinicola vietnamensis]|uniref:Putative unsaturated glucuronyl hydrolase n=1 Tax=Echinicola vietnamensis (strain DSM 17526 / LMG 23754 / KMM 6221) TaxID=926556 RepID=L0FWR0_ECHVK|nr:glycoside hydrolase family 88 protein [Echinicola vietnamensis]AGA77191.1 putative unsaturated glucuronyl hydrolase [Echinicola vietnamensis DSM 17526]
MNKINNVVATVGAAILLFSCGAKKESNEKQQEAVAPVEKKWSVRLADSDMTRLEDWIVGDPYWGYHEGLVCKAMLDMWHYTGDDKYFEFVKDFGNNIIEDDGTIRTYKMEIYNIDNINSGKVLIPLYQETGEEKFRKALDTLIQQLEKHPRVSDGGFWHKKKYPHQVWLDGLYMAGPFMAAYGAAFDQPAQIDDAVHQLMAAYEVLFDPEKHLLYHGWDESREQDWADKETGLSANFWSRGMGWFVMAIVDVLDFMPQDHPDRARLIDMANNIAVGIKDFQDPQTGAWYQVTDQGDREGNYLEASGTGMFVYFLYKGVRKGYLPDSYLATADKGYNGLVNQFFNVEEDGTVSVTDVCSVAGLGGDGNRDGSFEYYISEPIKENDPKGTAPAVMASIEHERASVENQ